MILFKRDIHRGTVKLAGACKQAQTVGLTLLTILRLFLGTIKNHRDINLVGL